MRVTRGFGLGRVESGDAAVAGVACEVERWGM